MNGQDITDLKRVILARAINHEKRTPEYDVVFRTADDDTFVFDGTLGMGYSTKEADSHAEEKGNPVPCSLFLFKREEKYDAGDEQSDNPWNRLPEKPGRDSQGKPKKEEEDSHGTRLLGRILQREFVADADIRRFPDSRNILHLLKSFEFRGIPETDHGGRCRFRETSDLVQFFRRGLV